MQLESSLLVPSYRWGMGHPTLSKVVITSQLHLLLHQLLPPASPASSTEDLWLRVLDPWLERGTWTDGLVWRKLS